MAGVASGPSLPAGDGARVVVNTPSAGALLAAIETRLANGRGGAVATLNLDHLVKLSRSEAFRRAYLDTDLIVADGKPVVFLARLAGARVGLAPGSDLVQPLCALAARIGAPIALYGSAPETLDIAGARLAATHPGLRVALAIAPSYGFDPEGPAADADIARIRESGARLCLVALGAPKQEIFAVRARAGAPACVFVSVGAGIDFVAGAQTRAPRWIRRLALEWAWRMLSDPRRLTRRYLDCALLLPALALDALRSRGAVRRARHAEDGA